MRDSIAPMEGDRVSLAEPLRLSVLSWLALGLVILAIAWLGYNLMWFMADDAYIAFRYASNAMLGRGLVWNPAPFVPVEGYTSFLWTVLLLGIWKWLAIEPPDSANITSFLFACGTLLLSARLAARVSLPTRFDKRARLMLLALVMFGTLTNRTFLTWMSSGLETALFNFLVLSWISATLEARKGSDGLYLVSTCAGLLALTRPDGLLFVAASATLIIWRALERKGRDAVRTFLTLTPLLIAPIHVAARYAMYGELVPNTYFAKHVAAWPESGIRYLASFVLEYGFWVLVPFLVLRSRPFLSALKSQGPWRFLNEHIHVIAAVSTLLVHTGYYTFIIGGDHFEFRVYSHLISLLLISTAVLAAWSVERAGVALSVVLFAILMSWPIPWMHWAKSQSLSSREETYLMVVPVAEDLPIVLRPLGAAWDGLQAWLIPHLVCIRREEHAAMVSDLHRILPGRELGKQVPWTRRPVLAAKTVGIIGWMFPNVAILDEFGLNDRVVAHSPVPEGQERRMAHDRTPPPGYVDCFKPNMNIQKERLSEIPRVLSDDDIRHCEQTFMKQVTGH